MRGDGEIVGQAYVVEVPTALRLDFDTGPVWFVAGIPQWPDVERTFIPGDEIMIVFAGIRMRRMGFTDPTFTDEQTHPSDPRRWPYEARRHSTLCRSARADLGRLKPEYGP